MNQGNGVFRNRGGRARIEPPPRGIYQDKTIGGQQAARSSRSAAVADFDGDGKLEIVGETTLTTTLLLRTSCHRRTMSRSVSAAHGATAMPSAPWFGFTRGRKS